MDANHGGLCLCGYLTGELLAGNEGTEPSNLAEHRSALHGVGPHPLLRSTSVPPASGATTADGNSDEQHDARLQATTICRRRF